MALNNITVIMIMIIIILIILIIAFYPYFSAFYNKYKNSIKIFFEKPYMNLITCILLIPFVFYHATVYIVSNLENQYPYTSPFEFICFYFIIFIPTFFIIQLAITATNLKKIAKT